MTEQQLKEIEQRWASNEVTMQTINDFNLLLAEVRRLNRMVDKVIPIVADGMCCPPSSWTMMHERNCWSDEDGCEAHWRKYLESEVG